MESSGIGLKKTAEFSGIWVFEVLVKAGSLTYTLFLDCYVSNNSDWAKLNS